MGYLLINHRGTCDPTGTKDGILEEYDTIQCPHCQCVIKIKVMGPCRTVVDSDGECDHCRKPVCKTCGEMLRVTGRCPGELRQKIERAWQGMKAGERIYSIMGMK